MECINHHCMLSFNLPVGRKLHTLINISLFYSYFCYIIQRMQKNYLSSIDTNVHFIFLRIHYTKYNDVTVL